VVGVDVSSKMVEAAREADPSIEVHLADAADLPLADECAELAVAFMSLQDIEKETGAIREIERVLVPGGRFVMAVVHPIASAGMFTSSAPDSPFVITGSYMDRFRYRDTVERDGLSIALESEHRPIGW